MGQRDPLNSDSISVALNDDLNSASMLARSSGDDSGRGPKPRSPPSSAATSSRGGPDGTPPPAAEGAANLEAIAAGKRSSAALEHIPAERQHAQSPGRAARPAAPCLRRGAASLREADYVPIWMRAPSWLYLPHQEHTAVATNVGTDSALGHPTAADGDAETPGIRGRTASPGTRKLSPLDRAKERLAARNAHLAVSLHQHAQRVEKRKAQVPHEAGTATAAERLAAIRRRLHARLDKGDVQAANGCVTTGTPTASRLMVGTLRTCVGQERPCEPHMGAGGGCSSSSGDAPEASRDRHLRMQDRDGMQGQTQGQHHLTVRDVNATRSEEDNTPETGEWSIEDPKIHHSEMHAVGIRMTTACSRQGFSTGNGGIEAAADDTGGGVELRTLEAEGLRGGHVAPPSAACAAAASRVAWHSTAEQIRNDR